MQKLRRPASATTSSVPCNTLRRSNFWRESATSGSDLFSIGFITYQVLISQPPYGAQTAEALTGAQPGKLRYRAAAHGSREIPVCSTARWSAPCTPLALSVIVLLAIQHGPYS